MMKFSLIVSTIGRSNDLKMLLQSLQKQTMNQFDVIIVDQNDDDRLVNVLEGESWNFPVRHVRVPELRGVCRGRNLGAQHACGEFLVFPDDDCWYPPWLLERAQRWLAETKVDILTGRAADETGRSINGRFETTAQPLSRSNIWTTSIEWMTFIPRHVFDSVGGFDEKIGPGSDTPWGANEGQEIILRALAAGYTAYFDPDIYGFHAEINIRKPNDATLSKARFYARGMGFVLARHGFGLRSIAYWCTRPAIGVMLYAGKGNLPRTRYYWNVARGRLEGWLQGRKASES